MLSKKTIQYIKSLNIKKYRQKYQKYLAEGDKIVLELIRYRPELISRLYICPDFLNLHGPTITKTKADYLLIDGNQMKSISNMKSPQNALAVISMPDNRIKAVEDYEFNKVLYLDEVRDPGNLGTIIRSVDWFDWDLLILSPNCADPFNPKVVQSAMGSLFRIPLLIASLQEFLSLSSTKYRIFSAEMEGESIYEFSGSVPLILIMGNESQGVTMETISYPIHKITIPRYNESTESLNVSVASSIILSEINRKMIQA